MIKHIWSVLCERISVDQRTNLVSYLTCIEDIAVEGLPFAIPFLAIGSRWYKIGEPEEVLRFQLLRVSPEGIEEVLVDSGDEILKKNNHRTNVCLDGLIFEQSGTYNFRLQMWKDGKWNTVSEIPLNLKVKPKSITVGTVRARNKATQVEVPVTINDTAGRLDCSFSISFDNTKLEYTGKTSGDMGASLLTAPIADINTVGKIQPIVQFKDGGATSGTIVKFKFSIKKNVSGKVTLTIGDITPPGIYTGVNGAVIC